MRKTLVLLALILVIISTGCNGKKEKLYSFKGVITDCEEESMLVKPNKDEDIFKTASLIRVRFTDDYKSCTINQKVKITYEGMINASYPASIGATKIEIISAN